MKTFERILCPIDFSEFSRRALRLAMGLADDFGAKLKVLHVVDASEIALWQFAPTSDVLAEARKRADAEIAALQATKEFADLEVDVVDGPAHRLIVSRAAEEKMDLVVMGTHGRAEFEKLFLGSVTDRVLHLVDIPLLAVSGAASRSGERFRTILMATDFGPSAETIADYSRSLARKYRARLLALHVIAPAREVWGVGGAPWLSDAELERVEKEIRQDRLARLERLLPESAGGREVDLVLEEGNAWEEVVRVAEARRADLIVVGAYGLGRSELRWLGSTCHKIIRAAPCPVLVVRERS